MYRAADKDEISLMMPPYGLNNSFDFTVLFKNSLPNINPRFLYSSNMCNEQGANNEHVFASLVMCSKEYSYNELLITIQKNRDQAADYITGLCITTE